MPERLIFISYRRSGDASGYAGRVRESLERRFGEASVFMDVTDIEAGQEFGDELTSALTSCAVFLPIVGRHWLTVLDTSGRRRLDNPEDWVRREVEAALSRAVKIIPVLVEGATMPDARELPDALQGLARWQALELSDSRWTYDMSRLTEAVEAAIGVRWWRRLVRLAAPAHAGVMVRCVRGLVVALAVAVGVRLWYEFTFPSMASTAALYSVALCAGLLVSLATDWVIERLERSGVSK